jgi:hypothetical protein
MGWPPIVIVNWRALPGLPTEHEHLDELILHHAMTRVVAGLESEMRLHFFRANLCAID